MIDRETALALPINATIEHVHETNTSGQPIRARVVARCRTKHGAPDWFALPCLLGSKTNFSVTPRNAKSWRFNPETNK